MRVLGRIRLSRYHEESTSITRQRDLIQNWADSNDHTIVGWAEDIDVSGSISPFEAPELGPWFKPPLDQEWDILCAWKLDRIARRSITLHQVFAWIQENDKTLVCISDNIDLSNWVGRLIASVIAGIAEGELEAITERVRAGRAQVRKEGRWGGGNPPAGYRRVPLKTGGYTLEHDPGERDLVHRMVDLCLTGHTPPQISRLFIKEQVPTVYGRRYGRKGTWAPNSVLRILRSKNLLGWGYHDGKVILNEQGEPIQYGPPLIDLDTYNKIQAKLDLSKTNNTKPRNQRPTHGILFCWHCGSKMQASSPDNVACATARKRREEGTPQTCTTAEIRESLVLQQIHALFEEELGDKKVLERLPEEDNTTQQQLAEAKATYADIAEYLPTAPDEDTRKILFQQLTLVSGRIKKLEEKAQQPAGPRWRETNETYLQRWTNLDEHGKRMFLIEHGITARAKRLTKGYNNRNPTYEVELIVPEDLQERLLG